MAKIDALTEKGLTETQACKQFGIAHSTYGGWKRAPTKVALAKVEFKNEAPIKKQTGSHYSPEFRQKAIDAIAAGGAVKKVAEEMGFKWWDYYSWTRKDREAAAPKRGKTEAYPIEKKALALQRVENGESVNNVAKDLKVSTYAIYNWRSEKRNSIKANKVEAPIRHVIQQAASNKGDIETLRKENARFRELFALLPVDVLADLAIKAMR